MVVIPPRMLALTLYRLILPRCLGEADSGNFEVGVDVRATAWLQDTEGSGAV